MGQESKEINVRGILAILSIIFLGLFFLGVLGRPLLSFLGIQVGEIYFGDLRNLLWSVEEVKAGLDPYSEDSLGIRPFTILNYPFLWIHICNFLGLGLEDLNKVALVLIIVYFILTVFYLFPSKGSYFDLGVYFLFLFSPAVLLCLERANIDLVLYILLILALYVFNTKSKFSTCITLMLIYLSTALKVFPFFSLLVYLTKERKTLLVAFISSLLFLVLLIFFNYSELLVISDNTPRPLLQGCTYGSREIFMFIEGFYSKHAYIPLVSKIMYPTLILLSFILSYKLSKRLNDLKPLLSEVSPYSSAYLVGAGIFVGTFLLGNNFNYRLIFLGFTLPFILKYSIGQNQQLLFKISIVLILLTTWRAFLYENTYHSYVRPYNISPFLFIINILDWVLFICFLTVIWSYFKNTFTNILLIDNRSSEA